MDDKRLAAKVLLVRTREKVEGEENLKKLSSPKLECKLESDCLYYWILCRLQSKMDSTRPATCNVTIRIKGKLNSYNKVLLEQGRLADYLPFYVKGRDFFDVVKETLQIYKDMDNFDSYYSQLSEDSCEFWVSMSA